MARIGKEQKEAIKQEILKASKDMFFEQGYDKTSTSQIAKQVGIAEGTIFNYFATKSDILLELLTSEYLESIEEPVIADLSVGVVEMYMQFVTKVTKKFMGLPKKMLLEIGITLMNASRKNTGMIQKLAALDFQLIDEIERFSGDLIQKKILKPCNVRYLAESIFSVLMYELMLYLYDKDMTKEQMFLKIKEKLAFELECRIEGE